MGQLLYYIEDFSDEVMPCAPSLESWAAWLALSADHPDVRNWNRAAVMEDGAEFQAIVMEELEDVIIERTPDGWSFSRQIEPDADFFASRSAAGGWDAETMTDSLDAYLECLVEFEAPTEGEKIKVAVCRDLPSVRLQFRREPTPSCTVIGQVQ